MKGSFNHSGPFHLKIAPPQLSPAPNPAAAITSPFLMFPALTASSRAIGMLPAEVLPYFTRFVTTWGKER